MATATAYSIPKIPQEALEVLEKEIISASQQAIEGWVYAIRAQQTLAEASINFWIHAFVPKFAE